MSPVGAKVMELRRGPAEQPVLFLRRRRWRWRGPDCARFCLAAEPFAISPAHALAWSGNRISTLALLPQETRH